MLEELMRECRNYFLIPGGVHPDTYTIKGGSKQENTSVRLEAELSGLTELLEAGTGTELEAAKDVKPKSHALWLLGISLGSTAAAAGVTVLVIRMQARRRRRRARRAQQRDRHSK